MSSAHEIKYSSFITFQKNFSPLMTKQLSRPTFSRVICVLKLRNIFVNEAIEKSCNYLISLPMLKCLLMTIQCISWDLWQCCYFYLEPFIHCDLSEMELIYVINWIIVSPNVSYVNNWSSLDNVNISRVIKILLSQRRGQLSTISNDSVKMS